MHRDSAGRHPAAAYRRSEDKDTRTNAPVHLLGRIPVSAMLAFPGKVLGGEEGRVHLKAGKDEQEGRLGIPGGKNPRATSARLPPFSPGSDYFCTDMRSSTSLNLGR